MENILVESIKSYKFGFIIKEQDLRRLVDQATDQFKKLGEGVLKTNFKMKLANGAIATTSEIDNVLSHDNEGSTEIIRLDIELKYEIKAQEEYFINIGFRNVDFRGEDGYTSMKYSITGFSKDWVFVTSSLLDERLSKLKRFAVNQIGESRFSRLVLMLIMSMFMMGTLSVVISNAPNKENNALSTQKKAVEKSLKDWKEQKLKDPTEIYLNLELVKINSQYEDEKNNFNLAGAKWIIWPFGILIALISIYSFFLKYYLVYNFCWGEYLQKFNKRESIRKSIFIVVILGLIISIVGGIITNYISK